MERRSAVCPIRQAECDTARQGEGEHSDYSKTGGRGSLSEATCSVRFSRGRGTGGPTSSAYRRPGGIPSSRFQRRPTRRKRKRSHQLHKGGWRSLFRRRLARLVVVGQSDSIHRSLGRWRRSPGGGSRSWSALGRCPAAGGCG